MVYSGLVGRVEALAPLPLMAAGVDREVIEGRAPMGARPPQDLAMPVQAILGPIAHAASEENRFMAEDGA